MEDIGVEQGLGGEDLLAGAGVLSVKDEGAAKYVQSISQNLVGAGLALNSLGCTFVLRKDSGFELESKYLFLLCAICYFMFALNTAGIANAIHGRASWLEASFAMTYVQLVYLITYSAVLMFLVAQPKDDGVMCAIIAVAAVCCLTCFWSICFGRPKPLARALVYIQTLERPEYDAFLLQTGVNRNRHLRDD